MNTDTGKVYEELATITRAEARGEKLVPISRRAASFIAEARRVKAARLKTVRRRRDAMQKVSRARNRR